MRIAPTINLSDMVSCWRVSSPSDDFVLVFH